jgi:hypothetical protein
MAAHCLTHHSRSLRNRFFSFAPEDRTSSTGAVTPKLESSTAIGFTLAFRIRVSSRRHCTRLLKAQTVQPNNGNDKEVAGGIKCDVNAQNSELRGGQSRKAEQQSSPSGHIRQNGHGNQFQKNKSRSLASLPAWSLR